ncbi:Gtr1/RagA G protein conserved region-domain-containing protein [Epithele typhae]|uniref:Gtr1/RagA G protein conserved region-domain-containing protein n=1 Tax=Epithele typhae TaxID=378194 RepID=UPI002007A777|nr:Gtr1/RagA G protein conserved region-domain-containing protein [Epithele typhae]KAH9945044.1 Gtr1/RagA G protein conserved region-domain-containing protein [Epithele typhae]
MAGARAANGVRNVAKPEDGMRTKILLLGMRRSGKTSIQQVLFDDLAPRETLFLETTTQITKHHFDTVIPLEIWDCPGDITLEALGTPIGQFSTMIFVIDIQDLYQQPIQRLVDFVVAAYKAHPNINLEVFVHKADVLSDEYKFENFRHIQSRVLSDLGYVSAEYETIPINFQLTSIYDHSLHDAFSRTLHKLVDSLPYLEDLLNVFCARSQATKSFLFDIASRLYVATDASPVDPPTHNLCSDYLRTLNTFGPLYKSVSVSAPRMRAVPQPPAHSPAASAPASPQPVPRSASVFASPVVSPASPALSTHTSPRGATRQLLPTAPPPATTALAGSISVECSATALPPSLSPTASASASSPNGNGHTPANGPSAAHAQPRFYPCAAAALSPSASGGTTLTYHLITPKLALLALIPTPVFDARRGLLEYNVVFFREGVQEICEVEADARRGG